MFGWQSVEIAESTPVADSGSFHGRYFSYLRVFCMRKQVLGTEHEPVYELGSSLPLGRFA